MWVISSSELRDRVTRVWRRRRGSRKLRIDCMVG